MVSVYRDADYLSALQQKKRILAVFWSVTAFYLAFCIGWLIYYTTLPPYPTADLVLPQAMVYAGTGLYILFVFPFMGIKYTRVRRYCKMLYYVSQGLKNIEECYFVGFYKKQLQKDSIDVVSCVFRTWSKKRKDWLEREAYFDKEKEWPDLEWGDYVRYVVQSNFIIQYEVLRRGAIQEDVEKGILPKDIFLDVASPTPVPQELPVDEAEMAQTDEQMGSEGEQTARETVETLQTEKTEE